MQRGLPVLPVTDRLQRRRLVGEITLDDTLEAYRKPVESRAEQGSEEGR
ncbi:MAG: hypothetical protein ACP5U2_14400 [Bryobacteraceae bacterium]